MDGIAACVQWSRVGLASHIARVGLDSEGLTVLRHGAGGRGRDVVSELDDSVDWSRHVVTVQGGWLLDTSASPARCTEIDGEDIPQWRKAGCEAARVIPEPRYCMGNQIISINTRFCHYHHDHQVSGEKLHGDMIVHNACHATDWTSNTRKDGK